MIIHAVDGSVCARTEGELLAAGKSATRRRSTARPTYRRTPTPAGEEREKEEDQRGRKGGG
jgi:hypothetical protein